MIYSIINEYDILYAQERELRYMADIPHDNTAFSTLLLPYADMTKISAAVCRKDDKEK